LEKIRVEDYAAEGKSLARVEGKVIFMENAVPGDVVDVQLTRSKKDWAEGFITFFHSYSPDRTQPFCSHFGVCGGCQWQMLPYVKQLQFKQQQVQDSLERIGKVPLPALLPIIGADRDQRYRNKLEYTFSNRRFLPIEQLRDPSVSSYQAAAGFHAKGVFDKVVDIETCFLQAEPTNLIRQAVKQWGLDQQMPFYDIKLHQGFLRTMQVRICTTGEVMVNVVLGYDDQKKDQLLQSLSEQFPQVTTWLYTINTKQNDSLHDLSPIVYSGKGYVLEQLERFRFKIGPKSFFQTNSRQAEKLYQVTRDFASLTGTEILYDLYCGTGSIGIFLSPLAARVIGVEVIGEAVADARENAALNSIEHAQFITGDVSAVCNDDFFSQHGSPDVIVTDPPRAGMTEKLIRQILSMGARRLVYVSCNPATQARDLNLLCDQYEVTRIQPVDMFPHTHHIENVVQLTYKNPST
jgi:23S rRNA (uracil1939-C5)-methyltransferase